MISPSDMRLNASTRRRPSSGAQEMANRMVASPRCQIKKAASVTCCASLPGNTRNIASANECWHHSDLLTELFGEEWHYPAGDRAKEENHKFTYLRRVAEAVQKALPQEKRQVAA